VSTATKFLRRDVADREAWPETCGQIRTLIEANDQVAAEVHHVEIDQAKLHYHARTDEIYYVLDGQGTMILGELELELHQGVIVYVPMGVKHKAIGKLTMLVVCIPRGVLDDIHELE
jgi:mannose-6-phosphate isomerase-like protein (cupin superfamily)